MTVDEGIITTIFSAGTVPKKIFFFSGILAFVLMVALFFFSSLTHWGWVRNRKPYCHRNSSQLLLRI